MSEVVDEIEQPNQTRRPGMSPNLTVFILVLILMVVGLAYIILLHLAVLLRAFLIKLGVMK